MIEVNLGGLFAPTLSEGVNESVRQEVQNNVRAAHRELMARRGRDIGFYDIPFMENIVGAVQEEVKRLRSIADDLLICGIGGSSLGGQALTAALGNQGDAVGRVHFIDNVDPDTMSRTLDRLDPLRSAAVMITKSGSTVETLAHLLIVRRWFRASLGQGEARKRMTFITDPEKGLLRGLAESEGIRSFPIPSNVGGRFSVLTAVGLLPAAFVDIDIEQILQGARAMVDRITDDDVENNPAIDFATGALLALKHYNGTSMVMMPYTDALRVTTSWFVQLWAESLGKRVNRNGEVVHAGQTPIAAIGATDQHAQMQLFIEGPRDKLVTLISVKNFARNLSIPDELAGRPEVSFLHGRDLGELLHAERRGTRAALLNAGVPVMDVTLSEITPETLGGLLVLLEGACALAGTAIGINPFDQPGVEAGKRMALGLMGCPGYNEDADQVLARESIESAP